MPIQFKIGCSGFYNKHWKNVFYPGKLPQSKWFEFYSGHFNTLELNTTFYRFPVAETFQKWYAKSPDNFLFSVKAPRLITHFKKFNGCEQLLHDFYSACEQGLKNKSGCILFQFPPGIQYSGEKLIQIINGLNTDFTNVVEFRHKSWWKNKVYDELAEKKIIFCSVSHPSLPRTIITNTQTVYIRLHGDPQMFYSSYSASYLNELYQTIVKKKKIKEAYIYFNNTAGTAGIINALQLQQIIQTSAALFLRF
jgi:uncharacterized protein YecE (DUF72 family)